MLFILRTRLLAKPAVALFPTIEDFVWSWDVECDAEVADETAGAMEYVLKGDLP